MCIPPQKPLVFHSHKDLHIYSTFDSIYHLLMTVTTSLLCPELSFKISSEQESKIFKRQPCFSSMIFNFSSLIYPHISLQGKKSSNKITHEKRALANINHSITLNDAHHLPFKIYI